MNLFHSISPGQPPAQIAEKGELAVNRERVLQTLLVVVGIATLIGYTATAISLFPQQQYGRMIWYTAASLAVFVFVAYRKLPYTLRAWVVVIPLLVTSILTFHTDGLSGNGKLFMLTFTTLTTILLGWKAGVFALIFSQVGLSGLVWMMVTGIISLPTGTSAATAADLFPWVTAGILLTIMSIVVIAALGMLIHGLETSFLRVNCLSNNLVQERNSLQAQVEQSSSELHSRMAQFLTASEISKTISSFRDPSLLLPQIAELIQERFHLYYVGVFITDDAGNAVLRAGTGEAGEKMLAAHHSLPVGGASMIGWSIVNRQARVALDAGMEAVRFNNPALPNTRSEMAIPIMREQICLGALSIQSEQPHAFDQNDIQILQGIADSLAIALENTRLYQQSQESLDEVRSLNREYLQQAWTGYTDEHGNFSYTYENAAAAGKPGGTQFQIPLSLRDQTIGQVTLETDAAPLTPDQMEFIDAISTQTALALENARLLEETQRRATHEQTLNQLTVDFSRAFSIDDILKSALRQLSRLPAVNEVSVHLVPPEKPVPGPSHSGGNGYPPGNGKEVKS